MSKDALPAEVVRFLQERIDSVPHLEALLIIWRSGTTWDAQGMAARIYAEESAAQAVLQDLQRAGLVVSEDHISFEFNTHSDADCALVPEVAESYRRNVRRVATLIHNKASVSVREFARAFDLKRKP